MMKNLLLLIFFVSAALSVTGQDSESLVFVGDDYVLDEKTENKAVYYLKDESPDSWKVQLTVRKIRYSRTVDSDQWILKIKEKTANASSFEIIKMSPQASVFRAQFNQPTHSLIQIGIIMREPDDLQLITLSMKEDDLEPVVSKYFEEKWIAFLENLYDTKTL